MADKQEFTQEAAELKEAIDAIVGSQSRKKLIVAGPGTGKTTLFKLLLKASPGNPDERVVLTFINNLKNDLENDLGDLARVFTLHSFCLGALYRDPDLRGPLSADLRCCPGLATLIAEDWKIIYGGESPKFVAQMRALAEENDLEFYLGRGDYYDAVDFDDSVYRVQRGFAFGGATPPSYDLVLIDEYQDFNRLEAAIIDALSGTSPILIAGDDDQALYSQLRNASWEHIRGLSKAGEYEVFTLPFCMRCPKVVVDAVADVLMRAQELDRLQGRIEKPYRHFPLAKGEDSVKYPKIANVRTSVQSKRVNYMGRFIAQALRAIPPSEMEEAIEGRFPVALVIVARPYRDQILEYLQGEGIPIEAREEPSSGIDRAMGLQVLKENANSNLGWRILLNADQPKFLHDAVLATADGRLRLVDEIPLEYRESVKAEVATYEPPAENEGVCDEIGNEAKIEATLPTVRITSFEGAKGLSAQHVFMAGLHDGELPADPASIKDLEICKFVVGLTRTRKRCYLIHTGHFGVDWKTSSCFISWIADERLDDTVVNKEYWESQEEDRG